MMSRRIHRGVKYNIFFALRVLFLSGYFMTMTTDLLSMVITTV